MGHRFVAVVPIGIAEGGYRPEQQPSDFASVAKSLPNIGVRPVSSDQGSRHDVATLFGDQGAAFTDPGADDELPWLTFELAQHHVYRSRDPGHHGGSVRVDQLGNLFAVGALERTNLIG